MRFVDKSGASSGAFKFKKNKSPRALRKFAVTGVCLAMTLSASLSAYSYVSVNGSGETVPEGSASGGGSGSTASRGQSYVAVDSSGNPVSDGAGNAPGSGASSASSPAGPGNAAQGGALSDNYLAWEEIDDLIHTYNVTVLTNRNNFSKDERRKMDADEVVEYLLDQAEDYDELADEAEDSGGGDAATGMAMTVATYRVQANSLRQQAESSVVNGETIKLGYEQMEMEIADSARTLFLNYILSGYEQEYAEKNIAYLEKLVNSASTKLNVGTGTETELLTARENLSNARAQLIVTNANTANYRRNLLVLCGWDHDSDAVIGELPAVDPESVNSINYEADRQTALAANITLKTDQIMLDNAKSGGYDDYVEEQNEDQLKNDTANFNVNFKACYDSLVNARNSWQNAAGSLDLAEQNLNTASRQFSLGIISAIDYEGTQISRESALLSERTAYIDLVSAFAKYDSALRGNL